MLATEASTRVQHSVAVDAPTWHQKRGSGRQGGQRAPQGCAPGKMPLPGKAKRPCECTASNTRK